MGYDALRCRARSWLAARLDAAVVLAFWCVNGGGGCRMALRILPALLLLATTLGGSLRSILPGRPIRQLAALLLPDGGRRFVPRGRLVARRFVSRGRPVARLGGLALLAVAVGLAGALLPGLPGAGPGAGPNLGLAPPPAHATSSSTIGNMSINSAGADNAFRTGDTITISATFSINVVSHSGAQVSITLDSGTVIATPPASHTCGNSMTFSYTVTDSDYDADGLVIANNAIAGTYNSTINHTCTGAGSHSHTAPTLTNSVNCCETASASHKVNDHFVFTDYDTDDDGLIEITTLAQLVAIEADDNGDGIPLDLNYFTGDERTAYEAAFPDRKFFAPGRNGCYRAGPPVSTDCIGYELMNDLDFDTNDDGQINNDDDFPNPRPFGVQEFATGWTATFDGNGHTIANLRQDRPVPQSYAGLFGHVTGGVIRNVGLKDADITSNVNTVQMGALVGYTNGASVQNCWATGRVRATSTNTSGRWVGGLIGFSDQPVQNSWSSATVSLTDNPRGDAVAGGLVGYAQGNITASYATGAVSGGGAASGDVSHIGGLVGRQNGGGISASYATGAVSSTTANNAGGLVGYLQSGSITASYATGAVNAGSGANTGGLVGSSAGAISHSYWDADTSGIDDDNDDTAPEGRTTDQLQNPTYYTGIYQNWNVNVDGTAGGDWPWHFGSSSQYPALKWGKTRQGVYDQYDGNLPAARDYDGNNNGLIDIGSLQQLDAVRFDLNGSGADGLTGDALRDYQLAFPGLTDGMGCPGACAGYELTGDLDFADSAHTLGAGWAPFGVYTATFQGNGHAIANMFINSTDRQLVGLFGQVTGGTIEGVGLPDVDITSSYSYPSGSDQDIRFLRVGALVGHLVNGTVRYGYSTGTVEANAGSDYVAIRAGGLVGRARDNSHIAASWSAADVTSTSPAFEEEDSLGGLVGRLGGASGGVRARVTSSYATGSVTPGRFENHAGGLIGVVWHSIITDSYALGVPAAGGARGGLIGRAWVPNTLTVTASYWDTDTTTISDDAGDDAPEGKTTSQLVTPAGYTGIYADWDEDVDGRAGNDDPWDFGAGSSAGSGGQYPILKFGHSAASIALQRAAALRLDYDADDNGLLEVSSLAQLNAIRWDLDGDGVNPTSADDYDAAFVGRMPATAAYGLNGCPLAGCEGYELTASLDFDTDGDDTADAPYDNWVPIGDSTNHYDAIFDGNGHTISNLNISHSGNHRQVGLFGAVEGSGVIHAVGLINPTVTITSGADGWAGALAGSVEEGGRVYGSYVIGGAVASAGSSNLLGGLVGRTDDNGTRIVASYTLGTAVQGTAGNNNRVGGLVGSVQDDSSVNASYAVGAVSAAGGGSVVGGLVGI